MNSGSTSSTTERRGAAHRHLAAVLVLAAAVLVSLIVPRFDWPCLDWPCLDRPCLDRLKWRARHLGHRPLWPVPSRLLSPSFFKTPTWGTYRPGYYFGLRRAAPLSTVAGLMWTHPSHDDALQSIRHEARQEHGIQKWGWQVHDGSTYGRQTIEDRDLALEIQWAKAPNDTDGWTARVSASSLNETRTSETTLFFYIGEEDVERLVHVDPRSDACTLQSSSSSSSSSWCASLAVDTSTPTSMHFVRVRTSQFQNLAGVVSQGLRYSLMQQQAQGAPNGYSLVLPDLSEDDPNVGIVQLSGKLPFSMDVTFRTGAATASASASAKGRRPRPTHRPTSCIESANWPSRLGSTPRSRSCRWTIDSTAWRRTRSATCSEASGTGTGARWLRSATTTGTGRRSICGRRPSFPPSPPARSSPEVSYGTRDFTTC